MTSLRLRAPSGIVVADHVELATSMWQRFMGLMGRDSLPDGHGLLLRPCGSIHMFFMRFAIDAVFLDRQNRILRIHHGIRPWRMTMPVRRAKMCIELPAGTARSAGLTVGDTVELEQRPASVEVT